MPRSGANARRKKTVFDGDQYRHFPGQVALFQGENGLTFVIPLLEQATSLCALKR